jgi:hypothetical protein
MGAARGVPWCRASLEWAAALIRNCPTRSSGSSPFAMPIFRDASLTLREVGTPYRHPHARVSPRASLRPQLPSRPTVTLARACECTYLSSHCSSARLRLRLRCSLCAEVDVCAASRLMIPPPNAEQLPMPLTPSLMRFRDVSYVDEWTTGIAKGAK